MAKQITIELEPWLYGAIAAQAEAWQCTETEVIQSALKLMLGTDATSLQAMVEQLVSAQIAQKLQASSASPVPKTTAPTIRALQIGDIVQIRDQSSPHFLEKLPIIKVGMLMASVQTASGEQSFLKRDLRFLGDQEADHK